MARYLPDTPMDQVTVRLAGTKLPVNMVDPVSTLKEQRVVLELKETEFRKVIRFFEHFFLRTWRLRVKFSRTVTDSRVFQIFN